MDNEEKNIDEIDELKGSKETQEFGSMFDDAPQDASLDDMDSLFAQDVKEEPQEEIQQENQQELQEDIEEVVEKEVAEEAVEKEQAEQELLHENEEPLEKSPFLDAIEDDLQKIEEDVVSQEEVQEAKPVESYVSTCDELEEEVSQAEKLITVRPVKFQEFEDVPAKRAIKKNLDIMQDVSMHISVELGRTKSSIREVMEMTQGSIVELDKIAGEQVEVYVNEKLIAKGEVIVIEDKFGVRITSTSLPKNIN